MFTNVRRWRLLAGGVAAGLAGVVSFAGNTASAQPLVPPPPQPAPIVTAPLAVQAAPAPAPVAAPPAPVQGLAATPAVPAVQPAGLPQALPQPAAVPPPAPAPQPPTIAPAASGTIADYFHAHNVTLQRQTAAGFTALNIVLPMPTGWSTVPDPNVPDAFAVIADRSGGDGLYTPNAALQVYKLVGDFDPKEAISHGFIDSQQQTAWRSTDGSMADWGGMPSSVIEGTYRENNLTLNTSRRHVVAMSGTDRYLVTLSVTTSAQVSVATGAATDAIVNGFRVSAPGAPAPAVPAPPAPPAAPPAPARAAAVPAAPAVPGVPVGLTR